METGTKTSAGNHRDRADVAGGQAADTPSIRLHEVLDLTQAKNLRETMAAQICAGPVVLDASAVERMSTPCVQVLLAAARATDLAGCSFRITNASDVFLAAIADLGLEAEFKNWVV